MRAGRGYGQRYVRGVKGTAIRDERGLICRWEGQTRGHYEYIHRWVWEQINGPIPEGMEILDHLLLGTHADNQRDMAAKHRGYGHGITKTHCPQGHLYDEANTYYKLTRSGYINRICRTCAREATRRRRANREGE